MALAMDPVLAFAVARAFSVAREAASTERVIVRAAVGVARLVVILVAGAPRLREVRRLACQVWWGLALLALARGTGQVVACLALASRLRQVARWLREVWRGSQVRRSRQVRLGRLGWFRHVDFGWDRGVARRVIGPTGR